MNAQLSEGNDNGQNWFPASWRVNKAMVGARGTGLQRGQKYVLGCIYVGKIDISGSNRRDSASKRGGVMARAYCDVFDKHLPTVLDDNSIFMHDNARVHMAKHTRNWLQDHHIEAMGSGLRTHPNSILSRTLGVY
jgi:hypothetical protein